MCTWRQIKFQLLILRYLIDWANCETDLINEMPQMREALEQGGSCAGNTATFSGDVGTELGPELVDATE